MINKKISKKIMAVAVSLSMLVASITYSPDTVKANVALSGGSAGWTMKWCDEFDQAIGSGADSNTWNYDIGHGSDGWGNKEVQYYTNSTNNVYITNVDGALDGKALAIKAKREGDQITSGRLRSDNKFYGRYGRYEARIKMDGGMRNGVWPAFWMMGNNTGLSWPRCGEIDIMEHRNQEKNIIGTLHWGDAAGGHLYQGSETTGSFGYVDSMDDWHTYAVEWFEDGMKFFVDGALYETLHTSADNNQEEFNRAHYLLLNLAIGSVESPFTVGRTVDADWQESTMYVDYVRVYQGSDSDFQINKTNEREVVTQETTTEDPNGKWIDIGRGFSYNSKKENCNVVNIQHPGFAEEDGIYTTVGGGISSVTINGEPYNSGIDGAGVVLYLSKLSKNINEVVINYAGGVAKLTVKNDNGSDEDATEATTTAKATEKATTEEATTEETATEEPTTEQGGDPYANLKWTEIKGSDGKYFYAPLEDFPINNDNTFLMADGRIQLEVRVGTGTHPVWPAFSEITLNGVSSDDCTAPGAAFYIKTSALPNEGYSVINAKSAVKDYKFNIIIKSVDPTGGETATQAQTETATQAQTETATQAQTETATQAPTEKPSIKWTELYDSQGKADITDTSDENSYGATFDGFVTDYSWGGDSKWQGQAKLSNIPVEANEKYKVSFDIASNPNKDFLVQYLSGGQYQEETFNTSAGHIEMEKTVTGDDLQLVIGFGAMNNDEAGTYNFSISNLKVEKVEPVTEKKYTVTIDGQQTEYTENSEIALPSAGNGFYEVNDKEAYKPGEKIAVNKDYTFNSFTVTPTISNGASIRVNTDVNKDNAGYIRFKAGYSINNDIAYADTNTFKAGTVITTKTVFDLNEDALSIESDLAANIYNEKSNFADDQKTFYAALSNITSSGYNKLYIAKSYVIINYHDNTSAVVYSNTSNTQGRSIAMVAKMIMDNGYPGYTSSAQKEYIDYFASFYK